MNELTKLIANELEFIYDNYDEFVCALCKNSKDVMDMYQVSFSDEDMYFKYVLESGQHISDSITITEYIKIKELLEE